MTPHWWRFRLPECVAWVPASTEAHARELLTATCYRGAPVDAWPCLGWWQGTRDELVPLLLELGMR